MSEPKTSTEQVYHPEKHNLSDHGFRVEVRARFGKPVQWGDILIGSDWQRLPTIRETHPSMGVTRDGYVRHGLAASTDSIYDTLTDTHSYMGAIALAASVMAVHDLNLECRLVEYKRTVSYEVHKHDFLSFPTSFELMIERAIQRKETEKKDG